MTSQTNPTIPSGISSSNSTDRNVDEDVSALLAHASVIARGVTALESTADALQQKLSSAKESNEVQFFQSRLERVENELSQVNEMLRKKNTDLSEAKREIKSKDITCSTLIREVERQAALLRRMSQIHGFELPNDNDVDSLSLVQELNSQRVASRDDTADHAEVTPEQHVQRSEIEDVVSCQGQSNSHSMVQSNTADTARSTATTMTSLTSESSESSEWSSGTSSMSSSLPSTSIEFQQSHRHPHAVGPPGPTAPPESFNHATREQMIDRILKLQEDLRKVAMINGQWKQDYDHMKSSAQKERDRLIGIIRQKEKEKEHSKASHAAAAAQETIDKLSQERDTAQRQAEQTQTEAGKLRRELRQTQQQLDELLQQRVQEGQSVETLKQQLRTAVSELESYQNQTSNQRRENDELKQQVQLLERRLADIYAKLQDVMTHPEPQVTDDRPFVPPREKVPKKTSVPRMEAKAKNMGVVGPEMLSKQSGKSGNQEKIRRKINEQLQHTSSHKTEM